MAIDPQKETYTAEELARLLGVKKVSVNPLIRRHDCKPTAMAAPAGFHEQQPWHCTRAFARLRRADGGLLSPGSEIILPLAGARSAHPDNPLATCNPATRSWTAGMIDASWPKLAG